MYRTKSEQHNMQSAGAQYFSKKHLSFCPAITEAPTVVIRTF
jgi:hypothetical protein